MNRTETLFVKGMVRLINNLDGHFFQNLLKVHFRNLNKMMSVPALEKPVNAIGYSQTNSQEFSILMIPRNC